MHELTKLSFGIQGPVGVSNKHVETAIDEGSGKLTMLYQVNVADHEVMQCTAMEIQRRRELHGLVVCERACAVPYSLLDRP